MVPTSAIATFAGIDRLFVVKDGQVSEKRIRAGRRSEAGVEVLEGITSGDEVVINPGNLADGEKVIVTGGGE